MAGTLRNALIAAAAVSAAVAGLFALANNVANSDAAAVPDPRTYVDTGSVRDAPQGAVFTPVARLKVPSGKYLISGKALVSHQSNGVDCYLDVGKKTIDAASFGDNNVSGEFRLSTLSVEAAKAFGGNRTIVLKCRAGSPNWSARDVVLTATSVNSIIG